MRCKPGDLAILVARMTPKQREACRGKNVTRESNRGKIVRCIRNIGRQKLYLLGEVDDIWEIDPPLNAMKEGEVSRLCPDAWLIPIRDPGDDATDEMVQLLGKPQTTDANVR